MTGREPSPAEQRLLACAATGESLVLGSSEGATDPGQFRNWPQDREIRAELLVDLLTGRGGGLASGPPRAVRLAGARIVGPLDLNAAIVTCPAIAFFGCGFDHEIDLGSAQLTSLAVADSYAPRIEANGLLASGTVNLFGIHAEQVCFVTATIGGQLNLNGARLTGRDGVALEAWGLTVDRDLWAQKGLQASGAVQLNGVRIGGSLGLDGAQLRNPDGFALYAPHLEVGREMTCSEGFTAVGTVDLSASHIRRRLDLRGARLEYEPGRALDATGLAVDGALAADGLDAKGMVCLYGAQVGDSLSLAGSRIAVPDGLALDGSNLSVERDLWFRGGCSIRGGVSLMDAQIGGVVDLTATTLSNASGWALSADRMCVDRAVIGRAAGPADGERLTVTGGFSLAGARIGGDLDVDGARLSGVGGASLVVCDAEVDGNVYCQDVKAQGVVNLARTRIGRALRLDGSELRNMKGDALDADSLLIGDLLSCMDGFFADGQLNLTGCQVSGEVYLGGATLTNPGGLALAARRLQTGGDVRCGKDFKAVGEVRFMDARIKGRLSFADAVLMGSNTTEPTEAGVGVNLLRLEAAALVLETSRPPEGIVDLTDARVGAYSDAYASWPEPARAELQLRLRGFSYGQIEGSGVDDRLDWLTRHEGNYAPGPYDELAAAYRRAGHPDRGRRVGLRKETRRRARLGRVGKAWSWFLWGTVGYGYRTWLAGVWLMALVATGSVVFSALHAHDLRAGGADTPEWNAVVYTADVVFPLMDLGHQSAWRASGAAAWWVLSLTLAGWLLVTAVVAGLTNALTRD